MLRLLLPFLGFTLVYGAAIDPCKDGTRTDGELFLLDDGCHPYYYECVHGESMQRPCAGGTVFDVSIGVCNHPGDTAACGVTSSDPCADGTYTEGTLFLYTEGCFPYYYECVHDQSLQRPCAPGTVFSTSVGVCIHPRDHPACVDGCTHGDLFIPDEGCYSFYFQCVHGEPVEKLCGDGLVFDSTTNTCNWPASVPACVVGSGDCHGHEHEDLYLPDNGCHNYFYQCVHGTAVKMPCPAGLAFNEDTQECDWPSNVPACPGYSPEEKTTSKTTTEADSDNCHGHQHEDLYLPDGGCHDYFYQCVHGTAVKMPCPAGLAFSEDRQICDWPSTVQACPEYPTEEKTTKVTTTTEAAAVDPDNCHGHQHEDLYLPDGGCHDYFYQCVHDTAVKMPCPAGLAFSEDRQICDWPATVPACPEYPTEETTTKMTTTTEATADSDNCHGHQHEDLYLPDGGCHDYFYQCVHGTGVKMPCPAGLAFSEERQICDWPSTVPACPEYSTDDTTTKLTTTTAASSDSDNCHGHQHEDLYLPDDGCHDYFYQCVHGNAVKMPCPAGLAFSEERQICDWPSTVPACPEYSTEEKTTKMTTTTEAAANPDNCHGHQHEDLYLPDGGCHDYFYQCVHDTAVKMPCPAGLAFSEDRQICDWPATVPACPEYPTEETTTKMTTTTEATADSDNCHGHQHEDLYLPDGGCHDYFYQCVHGTGVKMPCPAGLAFSEERQICDWPSTVPACPEYSTEDTTTKLTTTTAASSDSDNCHGHQHEDLYLPDDGCHDYFYQCVHGNAVKMPCPAGLAFSEERQICDWPSTVPACPEYSTEEKTTKMTTTTEAAANSDNCHGHQHEDLYLPDGGCHDYFYQCVHGTGVKMPCPAGLAFSEDRQICDWPSTVPACPEYSTEETTTKLTTTTEAAANSDNCHGHQHEDLYLPDGGCHDYFYQCVHGTGVKMPCPAGLAFSEERQICDWPSTVPACPEYSTKEKTTKMTTTTEAAANSDNCHGHQHEDLYLPDGGCHDYFYQCVHGTGVKMPCPAGLAFSEERQICDWPSTVPACPEYSTEETTTKLTTTTAASSDSDNCHGHQHEDLYLPDGGCHDYFYQCVHGKAVKMPCPAGLAFSEERQICDWPSTVPECPEYSTEEKTTKSTTTTEAAANSDNCHGHQHEDLYLPDGGCHDYFYQCVHGTGVKMPCPVGLAFSEERQICDWPSTVPACPEYSTEEKTTKMTTTTEAAANSDNCHGHQHEDLYLPDGGCHDYFYQCVHGTSVKMPCPAGLAFSEERQICDWPSTVPACPEYSSEEKTTKMTTTTAASDSDNCHGHQHEDLYLPDGGCHDYFYQCVHGTGVKMPCPAGLAFSEDRQICDWPSTVPACPDYSSEEKKTKMTTTTAASDSDNCHGHEHEILYLPDGGCHDYFYQCVHGTAVKMPCPAGLAFSEERQICDWPSTVPACPEYSNNKTTTAKTTTTTESPSDSGDKSTTTLNTTTISSDKTTTTLTTTTQGASDKNTTTESGTDSKGKSYVGFVVDVTGSMKKEIDAVKQWMTDCIDGKSSTCGKEPSGGWIVSSFNDPDAELEIGPTTNISRAISAVASLTPKGGWDCPEMAFLGLSKAIEAVPEDNDGCKMFFFSDATPKDVHRALGVIKSFIKKRCIFIPILTGCCGECHPVCPAVDEEYCIDHVTSTYHSRRRRDIEISESAPSEYSYYTMAEETGGNVYITDKPESADDFFEYLSGTVTLGTCGSTKTAGPEGGYKCEADCVASSSCWDRSVSKCFCSDDKCSTETPLIGASACGGAQHFPCDADIPRQIFPDSKLCNGFYMCEYARLHHFVCAPGAIYSATSTSYCDHPYNVPEPCGTLKPSDEGTIY
uniref:uncharacterized protein LOC120329598 isoform X20 n=1 Tax=Styela clava TaxID=7725 RepID=UPI00193A8732|nr:uncharacterized protein LOC120329598 isoform X20 [Styela clava]